MVGHIRNGGYEPTTRQNRAHQIMGKNMFGVEEAAKHFGVRPTQQQLAALSEIPFSEEVLEQYKDTHVLVAVFPLSILGIQRMVQDKELFCIQDWYSKQSFAQNKGETDWQLVRKTEVPDSTSKTWQDQQSLLGKDNDTPTAQVMVYTIIGQCLATGERLFDRIYVRTASAASSRSRVCVGSFDSAGLYIDGYLGGCRCDFVGVASARKFN